VIFSCKRINLNDIIYIANTKNERDKLKLKLKLKLKYNELNLVNFNSSECSKKLEISVRLNKN
jgi:hypothetical protein